jgi:hypothetical protein
MPMLFYGEIKCKSEVDRRYICIRFTVVVRLLTVEFEFDLGSGLRWGNDNLFFVTSNQCISLKIYWAVVQSCALRVEIMKLLSVVFCVITAYLTPLLSRSKHLTNDGQDLLQIYIYIYIYMCVCVCVCVCVPDHCR